MIESSITRKAAGTSAPEGAPTGAFAAAADSAQPIALDRQLPAADQIYTHLREAIITCRLLPNEPVSENRLCGIFSVSRSPVRIALTRLTEDGLIEIFPQRGSFVAPIKLEQVRSGHFVRVALELAILREAAKAWTPAFARLGKDTVTRQRRYAKAGDYRAFHRADEDFHRVFAQCAGLDGVWGAIQSAKTHLDRVRHLANPVRGHTDKVIAEHVSVLDALANNESDLAVAALRFHLDTLSVTIARLQPLHADYFVER